MKRAVSLISTIIFVGMFALIITEKARAAAKEEDVLIRVKQKGQKPFTRIVKPLKKIYFFDDWLLEERLRLRRTWGRAELNPEGTWYDPESDKTKIQWVFSVFYDSRVGRYRAYYTFGRGDNKTEVSLALAESDDGTHWQPIKAPLDLDKYTKDFRQIVVTTPQGLRTVHPGEYGTRIHLFRYGTTLNAEPGRCTFAPSPVTDASLLTKRGI